MAMLRYTYTNAERMRRQIMKSRMFPGYVLGLMAIGIGCSPTAHAKPAQPAKAASPAKATQPTKAVKEPARPAQSFIAVQPDAAALPQIVVQHDATTGTGFDWDKLSKLPYYQALSDPGHPVLL